MAEGGKHFYAKHHTFGNVSNFSTTDCGRAFRKLAKEIHPDRNPFEIEQFKEMTRVYKILSEPELRRLYHDHGGAAFVMGTMTFSETCHVPSKNEDLFYELEVSANELNNGCTKILKSIKILLHRYIPLSHEMYGKSNSYFYVEGSTKPQVDCKGFITLVKEFHINITKGMTFGQKITLKEEGQEMPRHTPGDVIVVLVEKKNKHDAEDPNSSEM